MVSDDCSEVELRKESGKVLNVCYFRYLFTMYDTRHKRFQMGFINVWTMLNAKFLAFVVFSLIAMLLAVLLFVLVVSPFLLGSDCSLLSFLYRNELVVFSCDIL